MSGLDIPALVDTAEVTEWSDDVDVVVIGFGIGGGCAWLSRPAAAGAHRSGSGTRRRGPAVRPR